jgi:DNA-binding HxlR family transcriptional regulator
LEAKGLVERRIYAEIPPRVEYSLTPKGRQIKPVMAALHEVGLQWLEKETCVCPLAQLEPLNLNNSEDHARSQFSKDFREFPC